MEAVRADGVLPAGDGDELAALTESFKAMGLSDKASRVAAVGRDDEISVRRRAKGGHHAC